MSKSRLVHELALNMLRDATGGDDSSFDLPLEGCSVSDGQLSLVEIVSGLRKGYLSKATPPHRILLIAPVSLPSLFSQP